MNNLKIINQTVLDIWILIKFPSGYLASISSSLYDTCSMRFCSDSGAVASTCLKLSRALILGGRSEGLVFPITPVADPSSVCISTSTRLLDGFLWFFVRRIRKCNRHNSKDWRKISFWRFLTTPIFN